MKKLFFCFLVIHLSFMTEAQQTRQEQAMALNRRQEQLRVQYLEGKYLEVINYYDSIKDTEWFPHLHLDVFKMAVNSCQELSKTGSECSIQTDEVRASAIKWFGEKSVGENWDSEIILLKDRETKLQETQPEFPGGMGAFYKYIAGEMKYPSEARRMGKEGRVYVQFVVNKDGTVDAVNAVEKIGYGCDEEAERVIRNAPQFKPGTQDGNPVYVRMVLPVIFKLSAIPDNRPGK